MKLPNGYGSVIKMAGHRRNPYMVRKTVGWHYDAEKDRQVQDYVIIGYAKTRADGLKMLAKYNEDPYDIARSKMTFAEVYEEWSSRKFKTLSKSTVKLYKGSYNACSNLHDRIFSDLKLMDLQNFFDTCEKNYPVMEKIRILFNQMYDFAMKNEICSKDYSKMVDISQYKDKNPNKRERTRISASDLEKMWERADDPYWQIVLMLVYNGCRVCEFLDLLKSDVHLEDHYFQVRKSKTESGVRIVPIADKVYGFYCEWYSMYPQCDYLVADKSGNHFKYDSFYCIYFKRLMMEIGADYTPHFTRHTTSSMLTDANVNPTLIKKILGHSSGMSLTERVYTHPDIQSLLSAINSI